MGKKAKIAEREQRKRLRKEAKEASKLQKSIRKSNPPSSPEPIAPPVKAKKRKITDPAMKAERYGRNQGVSIKDAIRDVYKMPTPLPGVLPKGQTVKMAMDTMISSNYASLQNGLVTEGLSFLGFPYLSELAQRPEYRRISEIIAKEMTRKWITLEATSKPGEATTNKDAEAESIDKEADALIASGLFDDEGMAEDKAPPFTSSDSEGPPEPKADAPDPMADLDEDGDSDGSDKTIKLSEIKAELERLNARDIFREAAEHDGFFGRAQIYIDTGDTFNKPNLGKPLMINANCIPQGTKLRLQVIEPIWTYPNEYNSNNPLQDDFYKPQSWFIMGTPVHSTRIFTMVSREVPDILKPAYTFAGVSLSQMAKPYIDNWLRTRQSVSDLVHSFSVSGLKTDMATLSQDQEDGGLMGRVMDFNGLRDNRGTMLVDKETEEFFNVTTPLGTLDHLQAQSQEHMASVSAVPLVKLLGITPSGLNASTDGEIRSFYDEISSRQEHLFRKPLMTLIKIIQLKLYGEIDDSIGFRFDPLWQLDEAALANVRKTDADTASTYIADGVISAEDERKRLSSAPGGIYQDLDPSDMPEPPQEATSGLLDGLMGPGAPDEKADTTGRPPVPPTPGMSASSIATAAPTGLKGT